MKPTRKDPHQTTNEVMKHIKRRDSTVLQCSIALGISRSAAWRAINTLHSLKLVHIPRLERSEQGRNDAAVYSWGEGVDVAANTRRSLRQNVTSDDPDPVPYVELPFWHQRVFSRGISMSISLQLPQHPHARTDWQAVAMFLAGVIIEDRPNFAPLIFQVVEDFTAPITTTPASPAERNTA